MDEPKTYRCVNVCKCARPCVITMYPQDTDFFEPVMVRKCVYDTSVGDVAFSRCNRLEDILGV